MPESHSIDPLWAIKTMEFVAGLQKLKTPSEIVNFFQGQIEQSGFNCFLIADVDERDFAKRILANKWPAEWQQIYTSENLNALDPVHRRVLRSSDPFLWKEASYACRRDKACMSVMYRATEFGMRQGFSVPIYDRAAPAGAICVSGEKVDLGPGVRKFLHVSSLFAYLQLRAVCVPRLAERDVSLSKRELEVLKWMIAGKSDWCIGKILHITERTVRAHVHNLSRKLNAPNRVAAVVKAVRAGAVSLDY